MSLSGLRPMAGGSLRLICPLWQGGVTPPVFLGAQLLSWLAPPAAGTAVTIPIRPPNPGANELPDENGVAGRAEVLQCVRDAAAEMEKHQPDTVAVLGGDCLADLAPFAYLSHRYREEKFGILWVDAHPDITTSRHFNHSHAYVLGNLMGKGDDDFKAFATSPVSASRVMIAGVHHPTASEAEFLREHQVPICSPEEILENGGAKVVEWIQREGITHLAIHLDMDVLDPAYFRLLLFCEPDAHPKKYDGIPQGKLRISHVLQVIQAAAKQTKVVGMGITELHPWDVMDLQTLMEKLPLVNPNFNSHI